jgi:hypothetical protein
MIEAVLAPAHAHPLKSLLNQPLAGAFDDAAANGQPQLFEEVPLWVSQFRVV